MAFDGYAHPKHVQDRSDCFFYHSIDLPEAGTVPGIWDLRPGVEAYLGGVDFKGKRVLEKAGYILEGRLRKSVNKAGQTIDQILFAYVRE